MKVSIRKKRRDRRPLRCTHLALRPSSILDDSRSQPLLDETQDPPISDPVLEKPHQTAVVDGIEETTDICIEHPVHFLPQDPGRQRIQRMVRAARRPEAIGETQEILFIDRVQNLDDCSLNNLVLQRCNPKRSLDRKSVV